MQNYPVPFSRAFFKLHQRRDACANITFESANNNRIQTVGGATVTEDAAGNIMQDLSSSPTHTYQWDAEGRLKSIDNPSGQPCDAPGVLACETYNALGQRVDHVWPGNRINWLYHPDGSEMSDFMPVPWNAWGNTYFNLNGRPIAKFIGADNPEWPVEMFFFHASALGSTSMMTWYNGDVVQKELFYPYGQLWATGGSVGSYRFASLREYLPVSDPAEIFMSQTRDYPSRLYRWMSPDEFRGGPTDAINASFGGPDATPPGPLPYADILNSQSLNKYQYAYNNPLRFNDPTGHQVEVEEIIEEAVEVTTRTLPSTGPTAGGGSLLVSILGASGAGVGIGAAGYLHVYAYQQQSEADLTMQEYAAANDVAARKTSPGVAAPTPATVTVSPPQAAHRTRTSESTRQKHEEGEARKARDRGGEKGDERRRPPRKRPPKWKGPWPPRPQKEDTGD